MKAIRNWILAGALIAAAPLLVNATPVPPSAANSDFIAHQTRHKLLMLPYYTMFDNLSYKVDGGTVTLYGEVVWPVLKSDAQNAVKRIEGVDKVVNNITVLPLSSLDNQIRLQTARAIYGFGPLQRYSMGALPPIHIIVDNGNVTLKGVVATKADSQMAYLRANGVPFVFSVKNDLRIDKSHS